MLVSWVHDMIRGKYKVLIKRDTKPIKVAAVVDPRIADENIAHRACSGQIGQPVPECFGCTFSQDSDSKNFVFTECSKLPRAK